MIKQKESKTSVTTGTNKVFQLQAASSVETVSTRLDDLFPNASLRPSRSWARPSPLLHSFAKAKRSGVNTILERGNPYFRFAGNNPLLTNPCLGDKGLCRSDGSLRALGGAV